jgi:hypothetical protein
MPAWAKPAQDGGAVVRGSTSKRWLRYNKLQKSFLRLDWIQRQKNKGE